MSNEGKTHFADDDTLRYIQSLEQQLAEAQRENRELEDEVVHLQLYLDDAADTGLAMKVELAEAKRDAERYRWLTDNGWIFDQAIALAQEVDEHLPSEIPHDELTALCNAVRKQTLLEAAEWFWKNTTVNETAVIDELRRMAGEE